MLQIVLVGVSLLSVSMSVQGVDIYSNQNVTQEQEIRKFFTSKLLQGLAATCEQVGKAVTEQDPQEKAKAAFGIVSSMLTVAADVAEKHEENQKKNKEEAQDEAYTRMALLICELAEHIAHDETRSGAEVKYEILVEIGLMKSLEERLKAVKDHFISLGKAQALLKEVCSYMKNTVEDHASVLLEKMRELKERVVNRSDVGVAEEDDTEEASLEVVSFVVALSKIFGSISAKGDVLGFLKEQGALLFDFVYGIFMTTVREEIEDKIEDMIEDATGIKVDLNNNGR